MFIYFNPTDRIALTVVLFLDLDLNTVIFANSLFLSSSGLLVVNPRQAACDPAPTKTQCGPSGPD